MAPTPPLVQGEQLTYQQDGQSAQVTVGSVEWFRWLETASTFTYRTEHGTFTARLERSGNKRGGTYWRAYRKRAGKLRRAYLGKSVELTLERLQMVASLLAGQGSVEDAAPDKLHGSGTALIQSLEEPQDSQQSALPTVMSRSTAPQKLAPIPSSERNLPTGTTTLLFTDIDGSTRLLQRLGKRYTEVLPACRHLLRAVFQQHHGHEVDTQGDAFFVVFARATDAVVAAVAAQRALVNHPWPEGVAIRVRMGLHTGEPQLFPEGYVGLDVHQAARIASAGHGGQVLLSQTTRELAEHVLPEGVSLRDLGGHLLKDLQYPIHLYQLVIEGVAADFPPLKTVGSNLQRDHLLDTKLHVPRPRTHLVHRSHLVERLQRGMECPLTLVSAPAGFGKTTLLAQLLAESDTPVAWLSLEPEDNDPVRFLTYLIAALQTVDAHMGTTVLDLLHTPQPPPPETVVTLLTNELLRSTVKNFALVLDDYHVITAEPLHRALTALVEHSPPQLHLMLATRADPPLPLARLRARGQLIEVRSSDLRFSAQEASAFLRTIMDVDLPTEQITALERRTEGWIAGLQLAALAMRGRADVSGFLAAFTGSHRFVLDYLSEEVLSRQPAVIQSFLLHTSVLERLSGSLCDAVTGQQGSQGMLEALERANLFVVALDDERQWYRYHHLFAEVLRSRLQQTEPGLVHDLHQRASTWYEEHHFVVDAVQHALTAPDLDLATRLIEQHSIAIVYSGQYHTLLSWMDRLPEALVRIRPMLAIIHAAVLIFIRQFGRAENRLKDAESSVDTDTPAESARLILGWVAQCRAELANYSSADLAASIAHAHLALTLLPETEETTPIRAGAYYYVARSVQISGDVTPPTERLMLAGAELAFAGGLVARLRGVNLLAVLRALQGQLSKAIAFYQQERWVAEELGSFGGNAFFYFNWADLLRERNELEEAERILAMGMDCLGGLILPDNRGMLLGFTTLARLQQAHGEYSRALSTMNAFLQLAHERNYIPYLVARAAAVQAQLDLMQGNVEAATRWADACGLSTYDAELSYPHEQEYLVLARVRIVQGRADPAGPFLQDASYLLDRLLADAEAKARLSSVLEMLILRALVLRAQGERTEALTALQRALKQAAPEGYVRLFVDEGAAMLALLREAQAHGIVQPTIATLLSSFGESAPRTPVLNASRSGEMVEPLTEREREVLGLLLEGASNREIARRLVLSINTVKRHIYNLCGKLGVQSRAQAIVKARTLNLL
jgi:LuxR family transcriptional regulator, maltose regulon positive regulatory protein